MPLSTLGTILLPTDFSDGAAVAFAHGVKIALAARAELDLLHVEPDNDQTDWHWAPSVLNTLKRWGVLAADADETALAPLGIKARRSAVGGVKADAAILGEIENSHAELVIMATHGRSGLTRWTQPSVSAGVATRGPAAVLLLPASGRGFVDPASGRSGLNRILVAVDTHPDPRPAVEAARRLATLAGGDDVLFATAHVGAAMPEAKKLFPDDAPAAENFALPAGDVVEGVLGAATGWNADLIVVATEGRNGLMDTLRGSTTERLVAKSTLPILVVPSRTATKV